MLSPCVPHRKGVGREESIEGGLIARSGTCVPRGFLAVAHRVSYGDFHVCYDARSKREWWWAAEAEQGAT